MRLIADKILRGTGVMADPGDEFEADAEQAAQLIAAGAAHPKPERVERAVAVETVERAVVEPEVQERVIPPASVAKPTGSARKRAPKKVSGRK